MSRTKTKQQNNKKEHDMKLVKKYAIITPHDKKKIEDLEVKEGMNVSMEQKSFRKIVKEIKNGKIIVDHSFQRDEIYKVPQKSSIINSAISGKSIPPLYAFEDRDKDGNIILSIIDGQQRLSAIRDFFLNRFELVIPYGEFSVLNGLTYAEIEKLNKDFAEDIGDITLDINVIRNISKKEAQEFFGLINSTSMPLSSGEKLWSIHDPVGTTLENIVKNKHFNIQNLRKSRKGEYLIATKLLWNEIFLDPLKHEFIGNPIKQFLDYFNSVEEIDQLKISEENVVELLRIYSEAIKNCKYMPRSQGDFYSTICFISILDSKGEVDIPKLSKFINWVFRGINKGIYPINLRKEFDNLISKRVTGHARPSSKEFVISLEYLYNEEEKVWHK